MNFRQRRRRNRRLDRQERRIRQGASGGRCYFCAINGDSELATHGELCKRHFNEVSFPKAMNLPDY